MAKKFPTLKSVESLRHSEAKRRNIPTAEHQSVMNDEQRKPKELRYPRNTDLDPQLVWRGKDEQDWSDLVVHAPPRFIQEKVAPKTLIDDLLRQSNADRLAKEVLERAEKGLLGPQIDLFADFNGIPVGADKTDFYQHDQNWTNRLILGDSLQVMASLAEREGLRGRVQCIYLDPPYGIKFNSNFQWSTTSRDVKDGNAGHITREPEQVKAFRDTWRDGIHSYLTYLRDRLTVARDLLTESGSIFVQIGDENLHRVRAVMDEIFGEDNCVSQIFFQKTGGLTPKAISNVGDHILWYAKKKDSLKYRQLFQFTSEPPADDPYYTWLQFPDATYRRMSPEEKRREHPVSNGARIFRHGPLMSTGESSTEQILRFHGREFVPSKGSHWKTSPSNLERVAKGGSLFMMGNQPAWKLFWDYSPGRQILNVWLDTQSGGFNDSGIYVVQTTTKVIQRCLLMATDPGDLVLDPTCGSGTTAYVGEQWGRRWITIDTSRVALALARARIMGARYPFYLLADSTEGQAKEAEVTRTAASTQPTHGNIRHGFVYERVPHITLKSIANNAEIEVIWQKYQPQLEPLREKLNASLKKSWHEWEIPREPGDPWTSTNQKLFYTLRSELARGEKADVAEVREYLSALNANLKRKYTIETLPDRPVDPWPADVEKVHAQWWEQRIARQKEIDASIAAKAEFEHLYDKPYDDKKKVRVAGPFTVESLSPQRPQDDAQGRDQRRRLGYAEQRHVPPLPQACVGADRGEGHQSPGRRGDEGVQG